MSYSSFLITNKIGGYFLGGVDSRYSGFFIRDSDKMLKVIDQIKSTDKPGKVKNNLFEVEVKNKENHETFFMPHFYNSLVYELNHERKIELILDCRESYDSSEWGRFYEISEQNGKIIIKFTKKQENVEQFVLYIVIDKANLTYSKIDKWIKKEYTFDKSRNSRPFEWFVYSVIELHAKRLFISAGKDKQKAIDENNFIIKNLAKFKKSQKEYYNKLLSGVKLENKTLESAYKNALVSLDNLCCRADSVEGIYAGLPWFFQFWSRDELISLSGLSDKTKSKKILMSYLQYITKDGRLLNFRYPGSETTNADSIGWMFKRLEAMQLSKDEKKIVSEKLKQSIFRIKQQFIKNGLVYNRALETWMDTSWDNDTREGFRIEIQAMYLFMLKLAFTLTKHKSYKREEEHLKNLVKQKFWNGTVLADGLDDFKKRPNVFIAAYFYPELLSKEEWSLCFQYALSKLWLDWGGLATIDRNNELFCDRYSGETPISYHRGDSWFWLNNIAAIVMHRNDPKRFRKFIDKIIDANEYILHKGVSGAHSELSSAKELRPEGSIAQAWSSATFIELIDELF